MPLTGNFPAAKHRLPPQVGALDHFSNLFYYMQACCLCSKGVLHCTDDLREWTTSNQTCSCAFSRGTGWRGFLTIICRGKIYKNGQRWSSYHAQKTPHKNLVVRFYKNPNDLAREAPRLCQGGLGPARSYDSRCLSSSSITQKVLNRVQWDF